MKLNKFIPSVLEILKETLIGKEYTVCKYQRKPNDYITKNNLVNPIQYSLEDLTNNKFFVDDCIFSDYEVVTVMDVEVTEIVDYDNHYYHSVIFKDKNGDTHKLLLSIPE